MINQTNQLIGEPNILLVEDDIQLAEIFQKAFKLKGYETHLVHNGSEAEDYVKTHKLDLIMLDIMLPGKDGYEILKDLKKDPKTRGIPVIMLTSLGEVHHMEKGLNLGAADYIIKHNVDFHKINKILEKHLVSKNARKNMTIE